MSYTHTHVTVRECPPPIPQTEIVGRIYNIVQPVEEDASLSRVQLDAEDTEDGEVEAKVVKARRGRRPVAASEVAETA